MPKISGPGIFLAQFMRDEEPFNNIGNIAKWIAGLGYVGVQIPTWDPRVIDLDMAADSRTYCEEYRGKLKEVGLEVTELASYLAGQILAVHPAYQDLFEPFYPAGLKGDARTQWAARELKKCIRASANMGSRVIPVLS